MNNKSLNKYGWPQHPPKYLLKRIYGSVPPDDNFMISGMKVDELERFVWAFRIDPRDFKRTFGRDLDITLDHCFEMQLDDFIEKILKTDNESDLKIRFTKTFLKRMGRLGFLYRHGFQIISPSKVKDEKKHFIIFSVPEEHKELIKDVLVIGKDVFKTKSNSLAIMRILYDWGTLFATELVQEQRICRSALFVFTQ